MRKLALVGILLLAALADRAPGNAANSLAGPGCDFDKNGFDDLAFGVAFEDVAATPVAQAGGE